MYGDTEFTETLRDVIARVKRRFETTNPSSLDHVRALLIQAGQLEQAVADANDLKALRANVEELTQSVADAFVGAFFGDRSQGLAASENALARFALDADAANKTVTVKVPEGFDFYALFPEQYCRTAERWAKQYDAQSRVLIIGLRSIGTALSAVVAASLSRAGRHVSRTTVRPTGQPLAREIPLEIETRADRAIIVDEGAGLSGSSMMAAAAALELHGFDRQKIDLFRGSENGPGEQGADLHRQLAARTQALLGSPVVRVEEMPKAPFSRMKLRCVTKSCGTLLWRFTGFGTMDIEMPIRRQLEKRALQGWTRAPLDTFCGFTAVPWIEGQPTSPDQVDDELLGELARYTSEVAGPPLPECEQARAIARLEEMTAANIAEALGDHSPIHVPRARDGPSYGDGRMMPRHWIRTVDGRLLKTNAYAHTRDDAIAGRQSILWDVAGTIVEWNLSAGQIGAFLAALRSFRIEADPQALEFYQLAYAAFRMGLATFSGGDAEAGYRNWLWSKLHAPGHQPAANPDPVQERRLAR
ncbi:MAG: hypothetical protein L0Y58_12595 [Verrucomicrobia subdivision 3 bacterium]|nr:hypothetical protein [Limisphaerales bacterium]